MTPSSLAHVALTGATGFVGGAVLRRLVAGGRRVRVLVRPESARRLPPDPERLVEPVVGHLRDGSALRRLVAGAPAVLHCAGLVRGWSSLLHEANEEGTRRLASAVREASPDAHVVHVSSLAAREPGVSPYAASKRAGERALEAAGPRARVTVLRPPAVYGPGDRALVPVLRALERGVCPLLGEPGARVSLLFVDDLAALALHLVEHGPPARSVLEPDDAHRGGYTWADVADAIERRTGRRVRRVRVPASLALSVAWLSLAAGRALRRPPLLTPGKVRELLHPDWVCDPAWREATSWRPEVRLDEGLRRTLGPSTAPDPQVPWSEAPWPEAPKRPER